MQYLVDVAGLTHPATIRTYLSQIASFCDRELGTRPRLSALAAAALDRIQALPRASNAKEPAPPELIRSMVTDTSASIALRLLAALSWYGLLRGGQFYEPSATTYDQQFGIQRHDIEFGPDLSYARITLHKGKSNRFNADDHRYIPAGAPGDVCPVRMLFDYMVSTAHLPDTSPLLRHPDGRCVTRTQYAQFFKRHALLLGLNPEDYAPHSGRSGANTRLLMAGLPREVRQLHGGWLSEEGDRPYLRANLVTLRQIAAALRLPAPATR